MSRAIVAGIYKDWETRELTAEQRIKQLETESEAAALLLDQYRTENEALKTELRIIRNDLKNTEVAAVQFQRLYEEEKNKPRQLLKGERARI